MKDYYGNVKTKSTVTTSYDSTSLRGIGKAKSNNESIGRGISSGLTEAVDHGNRIAYRIHREKLK